MDNTEMVETSPVLKAELERRGIYNEEVMRDVAAAGTLKDIKELPEDLRHVFVSAHDISPEWHVRMQAAFQNHTDNAVSKTVNFRHDATRAEVEEVYKLAWQLGLKGVTIYRDGSRDMQVLNIGKIPAQAPNAAEPVVTSTPRPRPSITRGITEQVRIGCGKLYVTVNYDAQGVCEVFTNTGKHGGCPSQSEAVGRLTSVALRSGVGIDEVIRQLKGIRCPSTIRQPGLKVLSCPDAIARVLERVRDEISGLPGQPSVEAAPAPAKQPAAAEENIHFCPECGEPITHEGGCVICRACGYSKCG